MQVREGRTENQALESLLGAELFRKTSEDRLQNGVPQTSTRRPDIAGCNVVLFADPQLPTPL